MSLPKTLLPLLALGAALLSGCGMPASCETQSDCPQATVCALGVCRLECPCAEGERCLEGACYAPQCDSGVTCAAGNVCLGDTCGDPACGGIDCGAQVCDPATRSCVDCVSDADCGATSFTCVPATHTCKCEVTELPEESCGDGVDNSCNRLTDCADPSCAGRACAGSGRCQQGACCQPQSSGELSCSDGVDDDCDGKIDCADEDCLGDVCLAAGACTEAAVCLADRTCAAPAHKPQGTQCRPAGASGCDAAEYCTGESPTCPADGVAPVGTVCRERAAGALCDRVEECDGVSNSCPPDRPEPQGTQCHASTGPCDPSATCDGTGFSCPNRPLPAGTVCKPAGPGGCDPADVCDGSSGACKAVYSQEGSPCIADGLRCTSDACNAQGLCVATRIPDDSACPGGGATVCCGGQNACFDVKTDDANCGHCGTVCSAFPGAKTCTDGLCCQQCEDDPVGSLCCGNNRCTMKTIGGELKSLCE
jgi:hypothetical protein